MKLSSALLFSLAPLQLWAASLPLFGQSPIKSLGDSFPVSGENPLEFCADPENDILEIVSVDLTPNPPVPGEILTIEAEGIFHAPVEKGAKIHLQVKYGLIRLINVEADLCDEIEANTDLQCPLEGHQKFTKEVEIPKEVPPGKYAVLADVYTEDKTRVTCLQAHDIIFH
ncbi:Phosphatidylglycerol/phosphatidylinositol transfer protein [Talaromyces atroroseus]|uniref:Phosphatidylglycerol/phosphatidylinositol transfer protein n=1 Tax=Talaromyces atroroseus TaxID=1441469 RepID=A0A225AUG1_TALAT|nr:Phosphatidylglycerol/phosphatidylinositol transfer protein [Talaromyces atroroseus]OKL57107.1 Phosphatidylglycerol/phosphatidylinositol transfer protein [Talaromyces atroroseus]